MRMTNVILDIDNLVVELGRRAGKERIIDGISLRVSERETLCLVGESGSGKSVTSLTVMGLLQKGALAPLGGSIRLVGEELLGAGDRRLRQLRATTMAMIFQEPMTALNPVVPVGRQMDEVLRAHTDLDARARRKRILDMMEQVRLPRWGQAPPRHGGPGPPAAGRAHLRRLPSPPLRRPAPAHHDRDGAGAGA